MTSHIHLDNDYIEQFRASSLDPVIKNPCQIKKVDQKIAGIVAALGALGTFQPLTDALQMKAIFPGSKIRLPSHNSFSFFLFLAGGGYYCASVINPPFCSSILRGS